MNNLSWIPSEEHSDLSTIPTEVMGVVGLRNLSSYCWAQDPQLLRVPEAAIPRAITKVPRRACPLQPWVLRKTQVLLSPFTLHPWSGQRRCDTPNRDCPALFLTAG